jgi:hypothetical protein
MTEMRDPERLVRLLKRASKMIGSEAVTAQPWRVADWVL